MERNDNNEQNSEALVTSPEHEPRERPRIYVASLSDYNAGRLHGAWIDANENDDDLAEKIQTMLRASPELIAEEWAIHDYEGFGPLRLGEYEDMATVAKVGRGIAEHGPAYAHWASIVGIHDPDELDRFEDAYLGHAESVEAYAEELVDDLGYHDLIDRAIPESLQAYVTFDVEGFARDLELSGDITTSEGDGGVYVFDANR
jgi:antirestriction protein